MTEPRTVRRIAHQSWLIFVRKTDTHCAQTHTHFGAIALKLDSSDPIFSVTKPAAMNWIYFM
jgi:hypothetical protein